MMGAARTYRNGIYVGRDVLHAQARMPMLQDLEAPLFDQLRRSMMTRDSLRLAKTTAGASRTALGYLDNPQRFVLAGPGYSNTPESMAAGLRVRNAPRITGAGRGASAGVGVGQ